MRQTAAGRMAKTEGEKHDGLVEKQATSSTRNMARLCGRALLGFPLLLSALLLLFKFALLPYLELHNVGKLCDPEVRAAYRCPECRGKRALFVVSQWKTMGSRMAENGTLVPEAAKGFESQTCGVHIQEFAHAAYIFMDLGMEVEFATPAGGAAQIDEHPAVAQWLLNDWSSERFFRNDQGLRDKFMNTQKIEDLDLAQYDIVSLTGGWGPAFDIPVFKPLGEALVKVYNRSNTKTALGGICHGTVGFTSAVDPQTGENIAAGRRCTGVTDKLSQQVGIWDVPGMFHPEDTLRHTVKCDYSGEVASPVPELFAGWDLSQSLTRDGPFVFGQNQNVGCAYSYALLDTMKELQGLLTA